MGLSRGIGTDMPFRRHSLIARLAAERYAQQLAAKEAVKLALARRQEREARRLLTEQRGRLGGWS